MKDVIRMVVVLTVICAGWAAVLSGLRSATAGRIEYQKLMNVQGPKVKEVLEGSDNDLITDRKKITVDGKEILLFVGKKEGKPWAIAYDTIGGGFGGDIAVMVGYDLEQNKLTGIQIVDHKETPGVGAKVTEDQFTNQFKGLDLATRFSTKAGGGNIDAVSGASYSTRGVLEAVRKSVEMYPKIKERDLGS